MVIVATMAAETPDSSRFGLDVAALGGIESRTDGIKPLAAGGLFAQFKVTA